MSAWRQSLLIVVLTAGWVVCIASRADAQLGALASPGPLAKAHASLEGLRNCEKCHERGNRVTAARCLTCHAPIATRMAQKRGVHRDVGTDCVSCHVEHAGVDGELRPFRTAGFNHAIEGGFALDGKHAAVAAKCDACHKTRSFLTLSPSCASCHTDIHKGTLGTTCERCHTATAPFKDVSASFNHARTAFPLQGAHQAVGCAKCHLTQAFKGVKFAACTDCHRTPHAAAVSRACTTCHTNTNWRTRRFDHDRTAFPLVGKHVTADCATCHKQPATKVKPAFATCATCHLDPHRGEFTQDCKSCHTERGFAGAPFDHAGATSFALTLGHAGLGCQTCHKTLSARTVPQARKVLDFRGLASACATCHVDPHVGELGTSCASCHTTKDFRVPTFTHPRAPDFFAGGHAPLACTSCHQPPAGARGAPGPLGRARFTTTPMTCASCHRDVHLGQLRTTCESCHRIDVPKFAVAGFAHDTTRFALEGQHATVACAKCHQRETATFPAGPGTTTRFSGIGTTCQTCHADVHLGQVGAACDTCHSVETFRVAKYQHRTESRAFFTGRHLRAACSACHKPKTGQFPSGHGTAVQFALRTTCVECHTDVHNGALGDNCARCHKPAPVAAIPARRGTPLSGLVASHASRSDR